MSSQQSISIQIKLNKLEGNDLDENHECAIRIFWSNDLTSITNRNEFCLLSPLSVGQTKNAVVTIPEYIIGNDDDDHTPNVITTYLYFYIFVNNSHFDEDKVISELHRGSARIQTKLLFNQKTKHTIEIYNAYNRTESIGSLSCLLDIDSINNNNPTQENEMNTDKLCLQLVGACDELYQPSSGYSYNEQNQIFIDFKSPFCDSLPLILWPLLATRVCYTNLSYLIRLSEIAYTLLGYTTLDTLNKLTTDESSELLAEMLILPTRCTLYVPDYERKKYRGQYESSPSDQWSRPGTFPSQHYMGVDCEDTTEWILELIYVLQNAYIPTSQRLLYKLQQIAKQYIFGLALGTLKYNNEYEGHAYIIGLSSHYVQSVIRNKSDSISISAAVPSGLLLETTNYTGSVWNPTVWRNQSSSAMDSYNQVNTFLESFQGKTYERYDRLIRYCMPASQVEKEKTYGDIVQFHTLDGLSVVFLSNRKTKLGVPVKDLLFYQLESDRFKIISDLSNHPNLISSLIQSTCHSMPRSFLPTFLSIDDGTQYTNTLKVQMGDYYHDKKVMSGYSKGLPTFTMRYFDYQHESTKIIQQLKKKKYNNPTILRIDLFHGFHKSTGSIILIQFDRSLEQQ